MKRLLLYFGLFSLVLLAFSCQTEVAETKPAEVVLDSVAIQYVLYPQQGLLELWTHQSEAPEVRLDSFPLSQSMDFPIGLYELKSGENGLVWSYPNAFYQEKLGKNAIAQQLSLKKWTKEYPRLKSWEKKSAGKRVVVMAEKACFACPHWMAEVYSQVRLASLELR